MKQWLATNWVSIFALLFSGFAALYSVCNETKNSVSRDKVKIEMALAKLDSLNKEQKELWAQSIKESAYKEDFYLTQLEVQSGLVILYVSVLFGIFGIVGYAVFYKEINYVRKEYDDFKDKQASHDKEIEKRFDVFRSAYRDLNIRLIEQSRNLVATALISAAKEKNHANATLYALQAVDYCVLLIKEKADKTDEVKQLTVDCISFLKTTKDNLAKLDNPENQAEKQAFIKDTQYDFCMSNLNRISLSDNNEIKDLCSDIRFLIKQALGKWG